MNHPAPALPLILTFSGSLALAEAKEFAAL
jgi:hypothetical protein